MVLKHHPGFWFIFMSEKESSSVDKNSVMVLIMLCVVKFYFWILSQVSSKHILWLLKKRDKGKLAHPQLKTSQLLQLSKIPKVIIFLKIGLADMTPMAILSIVVTVIATTILLKRVTSCTGSHLGINSIVVTETLLLQLAITPAATVSLGATMVVILVCDKHQQPIKWMPILL